MSKSKTKTTKTVRVWCFKNKDINEIQNMQDILDNRISVVHRNNGGFAVYCEDEMYANRLTLYLMEKHPNMRYQVSHINEVENI